MFTCRLCGKDGAVGTEIKSPCEQCKMDFPEWKSCRSCGRIFPDASRFVDQRCTPCENRREANLKRTREKKEVEKRVKKDDEPKVKKARKSPLKMRLAPGTSLPILIGTEEIARITS